MSDSLKERNEFYARYYFDQAATMHDIWLYAIPDGLTHNDNLNVPCFAVWTEGGSVSVMDEWKESQIDKKTNFDNWSREMFCLERFSESLDDLFPTFTDNYLNHPAFKMFYFSLIRVLMMRKFITREEFQSFKNAAVASSCLSYLYDNYNKIGSFVQKVPLPKNVDKDFELRRLRLDVDTYVNQLIGDWRAGAVKLRKYAKGFEEGLGKFNRDKQETAKEFWEMVNEKWVPLVESDLKNNGMRALKEDIIKAIIDKIEKNEFPLEEMKLYKGTIAIGTFRNNIK